MTVAEWVANGGRPTVSARDITVHELADRYHQHCHGYYRTPYAGWAAFVGVHVRKTDTPHSKPAL
jgi:hypothetical protein